MLPHIDAQLTAWAAWLSTGKTRLGYPRQAAFARAMGGGRSTPPMIDDEAGMAICTAIAALDPQQRELLEAWYRSTTLCTATALARHFGVSRDTIYARMDRIHVLIMGWLLDLAAGIPVPRWSADTAPASAPAAAKQQRAAA